MSLLAFLRRLRHGPLRGLGPVWSVLGATYRRAVRGKGNAVRQKIGPYGPFLLDAHFAFSDFENWGGGHNNGFGATIEACRNRRTVLDVGGHIGLVTLPVSRVLAPGGRVVTFEPSAANLRFLRRHLSLNGVDNVDLVEGLVADCDGEAVFYEQDGPAGQNGLAIKKMPEAYHQVTRPQRSLDSVCAERKLAPEIIKIDVEGAETLVLRGARAVLAAHRPIIFLSVHPAELQLLGSSTTELSELVRDLGYRCTEIDGAPVTEFRLAEYKLIPEEKI